jgi:hypothetical protein
MNNNYIIMYLREEKFFNLKTMCKFDEKYKEINQYLIPLPV